MSARCVAQYKHKQQLVMSAAELSFLVPWVISGGALSGGEQLWQDGLH